MTAFFDIGAVAKQAKAAGDLIDDDENPDQIASKRAAEGPPVVNSTSDGVGLSKTAALATPILGTLVAARETKRALERGDKKDALLAAATAIPIVGAVPQFLRKTEEDTALAGKLKEMVMRTHSDQIDPKTLKVWQDEVKQIRDNSLQQRQSVFAKIDAMFMGKPGEAGKVVEPLANLFADKLTQAAVGAKMKAA